MDSQKRAIHFSRYCRHFSGYMALPQPIRRRWWQEKNACPGAGRFYRYDIEGNPAATVIAATNIKQVAEDVFAMWSANNLFGTGCTTPSGISYDVSLSKILSMGLVEVNTLCEYWNATYKDQTATKVFGISITNSVSLLKAIEYEDSGFASCLSNDIKTAVVSHLKKFGCQ